MGTENPHQALLADLAVMSGGRLTAESFAPAVSGRTLDTDVALEIAVQAGMNRDQVVQRMQDAYSAELFRLAF